MELVEGLLSPNCFSKETCSNRSTAILLYLSSALTYAIALLVLSFLKQNVSRLTKVASICRKCEMLSQGDKNDQRQQQSHSSSSEQEPDMGKVNASEQPIPAKEDVHKESENDCNDSGTKYIQILLFYVQDAILFKVNLPGENSKSDSKFVQVLQFSPSLVVLCRDVSDSCSSAVASAVAKVFWKSFFGYCVMFFLLAVYFLFLCLQKCKHFHGHILKVQKTFRKAVLQCFILTILFSFQQNVKGAFALQNCVQIGTSSVLWIQSNVVCYTWWQLLLKVHIILNVLPVLFLLSHTVFYVQDRRVTVKWFVTACVIPCPCLIWYYSKKWCSKVMQICKTNKSTNVEIEVRDKSEQVDTQGSLVVPALSGSEEEILQSLLKHYKTLNIKGFRFTWLGVHKLYRVFLTVLYTYVKDPFLSLTFMTMSLFFITAGNCFLNPYRDNRANKTATLSYLATLCIAILNFVRAGLLVFDCGINCSYKENVLNFVNISESALVTWIPLVAVGCWALITVGQKCKQKMQKRCCKGKEKHTDLE